MMASPSHFSLFSSRKQREFTPDSKKDDTYWDRRRRNNAAAKRSREKRRLNDMLLEKRVVQLSRENHILRAQVTAVFKSYGIRAETLVDMDQVMATLPTEDQLLNLCTPNRYVIIFKSTLRAKRAKYVYILTLSGQKLIRKAKNGPFWRVYENLKLAVKQCYQTGQF